MEEEMIEMMIDLETLDVKSSALVLSIGAVTFECFEGAQNVGAGRPRALDYRIIDRFYRVLDMKEQFGMPRSVSQSTLLWWNQQSQDARDEAFSSVRCDVWQAMNDLQSFVNYHTITTRDFSTVDPSIPVKESFQGINKFWASPVGFDFGIWNSLADAIGHDTPWRYNQVYDVRTVLNEASYSAKDHTLSRVIPGEPHMPVFDCEVQIDELVAARNKIGRRIGS
jgi:hypothetical protein